MGKINLTIVVILMGAMLASTTVYAANNWEVRRLKNGTCAVVKIKPGAKPGSNRVAGPYQKKSRADKELTKLIHTPRCKRY
jgi:hypothetical protein